MGLRKKLLLIIGVELFVAMLVIFMFSHFFLQAMFLQAEKSEMETNIRRAAAGIKLKIDETGLICSDYAGWDDTYNFVRSGNRGYIAANMGDSTFSNLSINVMIFFDRSGKVVYLKGYDLKEQKETKVPDEFVAVVRERMRDFIGRGEGEEEKGVIALKDGPAIFAAYPVLRSDLSGPPNGLLVFGRFLDERVVSSIAELAQLDIHLHPISLLASEDDSYKALGLIEKGGGSAVEPLNGENIAGYKLFTSITGEPAFVVKVAAPRDVYRRGMNVLAYFGLSLLLIGVVAVLTAFFILEKMILRRTARIGSEIASIGAEGDLSRRVSVEGNDELSELARKMNEMIDAVRRARERDAENEKRFRLLYEANPEAVFIESIGGDVLDCNEAALNMLGYTREEILKLNATDLVPEEIARKMPLINEHIRRTGGYIGEALNRRKDGSLVPVEVAARAIELSGEKMVLVTARDLTERKKQEEEAASYTRDLEDFHKLAAGRELRMIELEKEINSLLKELGRPARYA